ncbi:MAG: putative amidohydrolase YtcJ [Natronomonas sp.]|jgi:predicted amidohydrolase YtcJ
MTRAADRIFRNAVVHTRDDGSAEAVAVRDGQIVRVGSDYEVDFLAGVDTDVVDLGGRHLLPGFVDAHTHLEIVGRRLREVDLAGVDSRSACLDRLRGAEPDHRADDWLVGFGYDESRWDGDPLTREDLDAVSDERPVAAFREDLHVVSVNSVALERHRESMPADDVRTADGEPTGVLVEGAADAIDEATRPGPGAMREYLLAAQEHAHARGITAVHEMVRRSDAPRVYRDLDTAGDLTLRVRLNYWADHLDAVLETGLRTNHGSERVRVGAIKTYVDGSIGGQTARLTAPYADSETERGLLLESRTALTDLVERADDAGLQVALHAIGDEAIDVALDALADRDGTRHRIEHAEVLTDDRVGRLADADVVVSAQPNFLKWAREDGLYDARLGPERRRQTNLFGRLQAAGARLAFGSDCMPLDPLFGIQQAVTAPDPDQTLSVTDAVRAYTRGAAYAGFDEDRLGRIEPGYCADFVVLADSPWAVPADALADIDVAATVVDGAVVFDDRSDD